MKTCTVDGCNKKHRAKGLCVTHYNQSQLNRHAKVESICAHCGTLSMKQPTLKYQARFCSFICRDLWRIETGNNPHPPKIAAAPKPLKVKRDLRSPLRRALEDGDPDAVIAAIKADSDIRPNGCWEWKRVIKKSGYPTVMVAGKVWPVHRLSLETSLGRPLGKQPAHHKCANSFCVNPDHLQPVTARENMAEMLARKYMESRIRDLEADRKSVV